MTIWFDLGISRWLLVLFIVYTPINNTIKYVFYYFHFNETKTVILYAQNDELFIPAKKPVIYYIVFKILRMFFYETLTYLR